MHSLYGMRDPTSHKGDVFQLFLIVLLRALMSLCELIFSILAQRTLSHKAKELLFLHVSPRILGISQCNASYVLFS